MRWLLLAAGLLSACDVIEVVVASDLDGGRGSSCDDGHPCPPDAYCERTVCAAVTGRCQRKLLLCDGTPAPVCGCDDVTYLNDCWRRNSGQALQANGECQYPRTCDDRRPCPGNAACARLTSACAGGDGVCWVAPPTCPAAQAFVDCANAALCLDACAAIATHRPFKLGPGAGCP